MATVSPAGASSRLSASALFVENGAGTYTADFVLPAGSVVVNVIVSGIALWTAATSAALIVGDATDPGGFLASVNLKATDLLAGETISLESTQTRGGNAGAYITVGTSTHIGSRYSAAERTVTASITSVGAGTAGRTLVTIEYVPLQATTITQ